MTPPHADPLVVRQQLRQSTSSCQQGCGCGCGLVGLLSVAGAVIGGLQHSPGAIIVFTILALVAFAIAAAFGATRRREMTVDVRLEATPEARLGDRVDVHLVVTGKRHCRLTKGSIRLVCRERAISRGGTSDTTYTHVAHEDVHPLAAGSDLDEGRIWQSSAQFVIPAGLPGSFSGRNNFIEWEVIAHLGLRGPLLDIRESRTIKVLPEVG